MDAVKELGTVGGVMEYKSSRKPIRASWSVSARELVFLRQALASIGPRDWEAMRELSDDPALGSILRKVQTMIDRVDVRAATKPVRGHRSRAACNAIREEYRQLVARGFSASEAFERMRIAHRAATESLRSILRPIMAATGSVADARHGEVAE